MFSSRLEKFQSLLYNVGLVRMTETVKHLRIVLVTK